MPDKKTKELTEAELDQVVGAGDPVPYPDVATGDGKKVEGGDVTVASSSGAEGGKSGAASASSPKSPRGSGTVKVELGGRVGGGAPRS